MRTDRWATMVALALAACRTEVVCPANQSACGERCAALQSDPANCGACGSACPAAELCQAGACTTCALACRSARGCQAGVCLPDVEVACFASGEVQALSGDLAAVGPARKVDGGPVSLAPLAGRTWVAHSYPAPTVRGVALDGAVTRSVLLGGGDLEMIRSHAGAYGRSDGLLYVSDVVSSSLVVLDPARAASDPARAVVDEVNLQRNPVVGENPHGIAFAGDYAHGQAVAVVGLPSSACAAPPCAGLQKVISLSGVTGAADAPGLPYPSGAVALGSKVYVALANLKAGGSGYFTDPAGPGKLLVIDTAGADALSVVQLPGCDNPGAMAGAGSRLWVACGGSGAVLAVDLSGATPVPGTAVPASVTSGGIAICNGMGYVTDQWSGDVVRFDPAGNLPLLKVAGVCPVYPPVTGFAWASDVTCAP
jgi:hypothetical protein